MPLWKLYNSNGGNGDKTDVPPSFIQTDKPIKFNPPFQSPKSISSFMAGFKSAVNSKIDDYIDEHMLQIPKYNRNNHFFFNPIITTIS